ncbi:hypothetical protein R6Q57_023865 [Mikania cordata]
MTHSTSSVGQGSNAEVKVVRVLTHICCDHKKWLCTRDVTFDELEFKFDKLKELSWTDCCMNTQKRDLLVSFLSITPSLENLFIKIYEEGSTIPCPCLHQPWPQHLKTVKIFKFKIEEDDQMLVSLVDLLLKRAIAIKAMSVIEPAEKLARRVAKIPQSHLKKIKSTSTRICNYSKSSDLQLFLSKECCFQLTAVHANYKF